MSYLLEVYRHFVGTDGHANSDLGDIHRATCEHVQGGGGVRHACKGRVLVTVGDGQQVVVPKRG